MFWYLFRNLILSQRSVSVVRRLSLISFFNVGLSAFSFFVVLSIMTGMNHTIQGRIVSLSPHLTMTTTNAKEIPAMQARLLEWKGYNQFHQVGAFEKQDLIIRTIDGQFRGVQGYGLTAASFNTMFEHLGRAHQKSGGTSVYRGNYSSPAEDEVILGTDLARNLGVLDGEEVTLITPESFISGLEQAFKIRRVVIKHIISTQVEELDTQYVFYQKNVTLSSFQGSASQIQGFEFWLKDFSKLEALKKNLVTEFPGAFVESWREKNSALFLALLLEKTMIGFVLGLAGILSGVSIVTVMILLISQKRKDIAVLKVLGLSNQSIIHLFSRMGTLLGLGGILPGLLLGLLASLYMEAYPIQILPDIYYDSTIPAKVDWTFFGVVLLVSCVMCYLASYLPARKSLQITPSEVFKKS